MRGREEAGEAQFRSLGVGKTILWERKQCDEYFTRATVARTMVSYHKELLKYTHFHF